MALVDEFDRLTLSDIHCYISSNQEENINLDFKLINRPNLSHSDDKKNLAKALSGFANSSGGLIVWGVEARKNAEGVDCAVSLVEIQPLPLFISRLNEMTGRGVSPIVEGVLHKPIPTTGDKGVAVTLVPESDSGPHMAKLGEDRYYKRSGDSFYKMEHFDLEDMFGRRRKPKLILVGRQYRRGGRPVNYILGIKNIGRGTAKAPYLRLRIPQPYMVDRLGLDGTHRDGLPRLRHAGSPLEPRFAANADVVIHPGTIHEVCSIAIDPSVLMTPHEDAAIEYDVTADDMQTFSSSIIINILDYDF